MKGVTCWCVISNDGYPILDTMDYLRKDAIGKLVKGSDYSWVDYRKRGWTVQKIKIIEA